MCDINKTVFIYNIHRRNTHTHTHALYMLLFYPFIKPYNYDYVYTEQRIYAYFRVPFPARRRRRLYKINTKGLCIGIGVVVMLLPCGRHMCVHFYITCFTFAHTHSNKNNFRVCVQQIAQAYEKQTKRKIVYRSVQSFCMRSFHIYVHHIDR